jgi:hypothetical protein
MVANSRNKIKERTCSFSKHILRQKKNMLWTVLDGYKLFTWTVLTVALIISTGTDCLDLRSCHPHATCSAGGYLTEKRHRISIASQSRERLLECQVCHDRYVLINLNLSCSFSIWEMKHILRQKKEYALNFPRWLQIVYLDSSDSTGTDYLDLRSCHHHATCSAGGYLTEKRHRISIASQ